MTISLFATLFILSMSNAQIDNSHSSTNEHGEHNIEIDYDLTYSGNSNNFANSYKFSSVDS